ncbi:hypothetical protein [Yersinia mollaretii]|nr:hypothetical protein [Yersinia mollaretii]
MGSTVTGRRVFSKTYWQGGAGINAKVNSNVDIYAGNLGVKVSF